MINDKTELPFWIEDTLERALKIDPLKRYSVLSEFVHDLRQPNKLFLAKTKPPLMQRDPVMFWQWVSLILLLLLIVQAL
jgi:hypothetical protein